MFKKIAYNTGINFIAKIVATAFGLAAVALMTRYLGQAGYGQYTTIITYLHFFGILADMGLTLITGKLLADGDADENKIFSNLFTFRLVSALFFLGLAPIIVLFFPYSATVKIGIFIATASFLFIALNQIFVGYYQRHLLMVKASISEVGGKLILVVGVLIATLGDFGLQGIVIATVMASFAHLLINYLLSLKYVRFQLAFDKKIWKRIISVCWPIAITITFNLIYLKADTLILSLIEPEAIVGLYGAAYRVIDVLVMLPFILMGIVLPQLTIAYNNKNHSDFKKIIQNAFDIMAIIALPLVIGSQFIAVPLMQFVAGAEFHSSGMILRLLIFAAGIIYLGTVFSHIIIAIEKQKQTIWAYILVAITALTGYLIFIPKYSSVGAAAVTIYSETLIAILIFSITYYYIRYIPNFIVFFKALLACLIMSLFIYLTNFGIIVSLIFSVIIYLTAIYLMAKNNLKQMIK